MRSEAEKRLIGAGDGEPRLLRRVPQSEVTSAIEADIIFGRFFPRERLVEDSLIERTGGTRHSVRTALVELERKGLIVREPNKGAAVRSLSENEIDRIYEMRAILQRAAAELIPMPVETGLIDDLRKAQERYDEAATREDIMTVDTVNDAFHERLFRACGNPNLTEDIARYAGMVRTIRSHAIADPVLLETSRQDHAGMIEALVASDRQRLVDLCVSHLWRALDAFRAHRSRPPA